MGELRTIDADDLDQAIVATEREIAGEAWGNEETDFLDESGDRSLEGMGSGLEGQQEAEGEGDDEGSEETDEDAQAEGEGEGDGEAEAAAGNEGEGGQPPKPPAGEQEQPQGRVPPGKYREIAERARLAEAETVRLKAQLEAAPKGDPEVAALKAQLATLTQLVGQGKAPAQRTEPEPPPAAPDIFENPTGFADHLQKGFETKLDGVLNAVRQQGVSMSFELAHVRHAEAFPKAMEAINKLDPTNPQDRQLVQSIYTSPNPGEALVRWHKQSVARSRVGDDVEAFETRIRTETRDALIKDPEFIKQVVSSLRGDAQTGNNGSPRTESRLPPSLKRASGASTRGERHDHQASDDSDQGVADAAWRE